MKTVEVKTDEKTGDGYIDINEFKGIVNIEKVVYYELKKIEKGSFTIVFYDKDKNKLPFLNE